MDSHRALSEIAQEIEHDQNIPKALDSFTKKPDDQLSIQYLSLILLRQPFNQYSVNSNYDSAIIIQLRINPLSLLKW